MSERKMKSRCEKARDTGVAGRSSVPSGRTAGGHQRGRGPRTPPVRQWRGLQLPEEL